MVGDVFQQALRRRWIEPGFDVPRSRTALPEANTERAAE
jgi:hypothetical protein